MPPAVNCLWVRSPLPSMTSTYLWLGIQVRECIFRFSTEFQRRPWQSQETSLGCYTEENHHISRYYSLYGYSLRIVLICFCVWSKSQVGASLPSTIDWQIAWHCATRTNSKPIVKAALNLQVFLHTNRQVYIVCDCRWLCVVRLHIRRYPYQSFPAKKPEPSYFSYCDKCYGKWVRHGNKIRKHQKELQSGNNWPHVSAQAEKWAQPIHCREHWQIKGVATPHDKLWQREICFWFMSPAFSYDSLYFRLSPLPDYANRFPVAGNGNFYDKLF